MKTWLLLLLVCISIPVFAQHSPSRIDSLEKRVDTLAQRTDEKNYVRIPNTDFDRIIENKVNAEVHAEMHEWQWIITVVLSILGFLAIFYFRSQLKSEVGTNVAALKNEVNTSVNTQLQNSLSVFWDELASSIIERAKNRNYLGADLKESLEKLLFDKTITISEDNKAMIVDALSYYYYSSDEKDKNEKMIKLVKTYENDLYLTTQTYANLAISFTNSYSLNGTKEDRKSALEYCEKSIQREPYYGTPYALKLELNIIYYTKGLPEEQQDALKMLELTFHDIKNNTSNDLPWEIIERLALDKSLDVNNRKYFITQLENKFVAQLNEIRARAIHYLMSNYNSVLTNEDPRYSKVLQNILSGGLQQSPGLDGEWHAINYVEAGSELQIPDGSIKLLFDGLDFSMLANGAVKKGIVYFITAEEGRPLALNLYTIQNNVVKSVTASVYKCDKDTLQICYGPDPEDRPDALSPTPENRFTLVTYKKL